MRATLPVGLYSPNTAVLQDGTLTLRPLVPEDAAHFETLLGPDADGVAMTSHLPYPLRAAQAREWIVLRTGPGGHVFGVLDAAGRFLGSMGFGGPKDGVPGFGYDLDGATPADRVAWLKLLREQKAREQKAREDAAK